MGAGTGGKLAGESLSTPHRPPLQPDFVTYSLETWRGRGLGFRTTLLRWMVKPFLRTCPELTKRMGACDTIEAKGDSEVAVATSLGGHFFGVFW